ncbi:MAG: hypothetical protein WKG03_14390 [Telluria sp.]
MAAAPVPVQPLPEAVIPPAPHGPVFDFTLPAQTTPVPEPFVPEAPWFERPGRSPLLWGSCMVSAALVILAGLWLYEARRSAVAPAVVADQAKAQAPVSKAPRVRPIAAKEFTLNPDGEVHVTPVSAPRPAPAAPPIVLLEPTPEPKVLRPAPKPERVRVKPAPERQLARAPAKLVERKPAPESAMAATLKACREHGYAADRCIKRGCSVTKYGFVCRGK